MKRLKREQVVPNLSLVRLNPRDRCCRHDRHNAADIQALRQAMQVHLLGAWPSGPIIHGLPQGISQIPFERRRCNSDGNGNTGHEEAHENTRRSVVSVAEQDDEDDAARHEADHDDCASLDDAQRIDT